MRISATLLLEGLVPSFDPTGKTYPTEPKEPVNPPSDKIVITPDAGKKKDDADDVILGAPLDKNANRRDDGELVSRTDEVHRTMKDVVDKLAKKDVVDKLAKTPESKTPESTFLSLTPPKLSHEEKLKRSQEGITQSKKDNKTRRQNRADQLKQTAEDDVVNDADRTRRNDRLIARQDRDVKLYDAMARKQAARQRYLRGEDSGSPASSSPSSSPSAEPAAATVPASTQDGSWGGSKPAAMAAASTQDGSWGGTKPTSTQFDRNRDWPDSGTGNPPQRDFTHWIQKAGIIDSVLRVGESALRVGKSATQKAVGIVKDWWQGDNSVSSSTKSKSTDSVHRPQAFAEMTVYRFRRGSLLNESPVDSVASWIKNKTGSMYDKIQELDKEDKLLRTGANLITTGLATPLPELMATLSGRLSGLGFTDKGIRDRMERYKLPNIGLNKKDAKGKDVIDDDGDVVKKGLGGVFISKAVNAAGDEAAALMTAALYDPRALSRLQ